MRRPSSLLNLAMALGAAVAASAAWAHSVDTPEWDREGVAAVHGWPDGLGAVLWPAMQLGNRAVALAIIGVIGLLVGRRAGLIALAAVFSAWLSAVSLKAVVRRPRPDASDLDGPAREITDGWAFPSGHASIAFAVATIVALSLPHRWRSVLFVVAPLAAVARIYHGVHFPSDVVAGAALGTTCSLVVHLITVDHAPRTSGTVGA